MSEVTSRRQSSRSAALLLLLLVMVVVVMMVLVKVLTRSRVIVGRWRRGLPHASHETQRSVAGANGRAGSRTRGGGARHRLARLLEQAVDIGDKVRHAQKSLQPDTYHLSGRAFGVVTILFIARRGG